MIHSIASRFQIHCMNPSWAAYLALHHPQPSPQAWIHHGPWKGWKAERLKGCIRHHHLYPFYHVWDFDLMLPWHHQSTVFRHGRWGHSWPEWSTFYSLILPWNALNTSITAIWYVWFLTSAKQYIKALFRRKDIRYIQFRNSAPRLPTFAEATGLGPDENHTHTSSQFITIHHTFH